MDVIKVMVTGGFQTLGLAPSLPQFTVEELRAVVTEAHRLGKHVAAHAYGTEGIRICMEARVDYIAHASFLDNNGWTYFDPQLADRLGAKQIFVDIASPPSYPAVPGETYAPRARELNDHRAMIVTGNDIGAVMPPEAYLWALNQMAAAGVPTTEILIVAASRAAAAVGLKRGDGSVQAGV